MINERKESVRKTIWPSNNPLQILAQDLLRCNLAGAIEVHKLAEALEEKLTATNGKSLIEKQPLDL